MSYQVLARKWRPQVFEEVVGQGHITRTLQNAIVSGRLAHAFLFSGPRGVGKTTTARILAKALNCVQGPTPTPCGKCDSCLETAAGTSVDVIEIDGASNRGIEHIRELRETVKYAPVGGKYKVYVIDEVHMLTNEAFNALLKTLEEPPPHVIFIFATTEPQKIPATIHSRCQRYGFKRVSLHEIIDRLRVIAKAEGIAVSDQGLAMIARAAEGSMRDSQSLLDQAVSYSGMTVRDEDIQTTLGAVAQERLLEFASSLIARDAAGLLKQTDALLEQGQDIRQFLSAVIEHLRNLMIVKITSHPEQIIELPAADLEALSRQAGDADREQLLLLFDSLAKTLDEMRWSSQQRFTFEIGIIKACSLTPLHPLGDILADIKDLEARLSSGKAPASYATPSPSSGHRVGEPQTAYKPAGRTPPPAAHAASTHESNAPGELWSGILSALKSQKPGLASALERSSLVRLTDTELVVGIAGASFQVKKAEEPESRKLIEQIAEQQLGKKVQVKIQPIEKKETETKTRDAKKSAPAEQDPAVQDVLKIFPQGEIIDPGQSNT
ncbi:MAG TPA: DNA polymerase III subunit gamma/tau [Nitrospirota bacterium]|nr:DNA polymerase III subunit gamma/tau [Nitrospirota bacterium]